MKAKCLFNKTSNLPSCLRSTKTGFLDDEILPLVLEKNYPIYAITRYIDHFWYYIWDEDKGRYPVWYPSCMFEMVDNRVPGDWLFNSTFNEGRSAHPIIGIKEWIESPLFYDCLTNGDEKYETIFKCYRDSYEDDLV